MIEEISLSKLFTYAALTYTYIIGSSTPLHTSQMPADIFSAEKAKNEIIWPVKRGETLASISEKVYGKPDFWTTIWNDNPWIDNPNIIFSQWNLKIRKDKPKEVEKLSSDLEKKLSKNYYAYSSVPRSLDSLKKIISNADADSSGLTATAYDDIYKEAGAKYGVPWQILYGLHLTESGLHDGPISNHQGSGAQGPMQFMPGTFQAYAVDADGDGKPNINNAKDAIYTAANFLAKHGSLENGLHYYGGNTYGVLSAARKRGYSQ